MSVHRTERVTDCHGRGCRTVDGWFDGPVIDRGSSDASGPTPRFQLLGPVEISMDGRVVPLRGSQQRCVLAVLLLAADRVVPTDELIDALWGVTTPPHNARKHVQVHVSRLRSTLAGMPGVRLVTVGRQGYRLDVPTDAVDLRRFRSLVTEARSSDDERAVGLYTTALGLWHGEPLAGASSELLHERAVRVLVDERMSTVESCLATRTRLGRYREVIPRLSALVAVHPRRENLTSLLMQALDGHGRREEALAVYRDLRDRLVHELGIEPSEATQRMHQAILSGLDDKEATASAPPVAPAQLPADLAGFVGRQQDVERVRAAVERTGARAPRSVVVTGAPGTGKTTLLVHAGHTVAERFPDGQLYAYLAGARAAAADPAEVLAGFLTALGLPAERIPKPLAQRAALFRSMTAGRRILVVLDDARDSAQVRPLVPAAATCALLVSSRAALGGLDATCRIELATMPHEDAVRILTTELDPARLTVDRAAADDVVRYCGGLPLALRIAGRRLATRPRWTVRDLAEQLSDEQGRLDELAVDDLDVRASFGMTYQQLDASAARAYRLLGLVDGHDIELTEAALLFDTSKREASRDLDALCGVHLAESPHPARFRLHDLLRAFAREKSEADEPSGARTAAVGRLVGCYATRLRAAILARTPGLQLEEFDLPSACDGMPGFRDRTDALIWLDRERANLVAAIRSGCAQEVIPAMTASRIAGAFAWYADAAGHLGDLATVTHAAVELAHAREDERAEGVALVGLGTVATHREGRQAGARLTRRAVRLLHGSGLRAEASALNNLAVFTDREEERLASLQRAYATYQALDDPRGMITTLVNIADHHIKAGRPDAAVEAATDARRRAERLPAPELVASADVNLAEALHQVGRDDDAVRHVGQALDRATDVGNDVIASTAAVGFARILRDRGQLTDAAARYDQALVLLRGMGAESDLRAAVAEMADVLDRLGQHERAAVCREAASRPQPCE